MVIISEPLILFIISWTGKKTITFIVSYVEFSGKFFMMLELFFKSLVLHAGRDSPLYELSMR